MSLPLTSAACWRRFASTQIVAFLLFALLGTAAWLEAAPGADCGWAAGLHSRDFEYDVHDFVIWDDGSGPALYAAGWFDFAEDAEASGVARWDGRHWWPLTGSGGGGLHKIAGAEVMALAVWDDGTGEALYAGGTFTSADGTTTTNIARWDGTEWSALAGASGEGVDDQVEAIFAWNGELYVGGRFSSAGGLTIPYIARWDGSEWAPLDAGVDATVHALAEWDDGRGSALYAGGDFLEAGGIELEAIARWDGTVWEELDYGIGGSVYALSAYGGVLVAGGDIFEIGSDYDPAEGVAAWNGTSWAPLSANTWTGEVLDFEVWNDGGTNWLYAAGRFDTADGLPAGYLVRWDGLTWSAVVDAGSKGADNEVNALQLWDDGSGESLWIGGTFRHLGDLALGYIGLWNGTAFSRLTSLAGGMDAQVNDFALWDDGTGLALYAAGYYDFAGAEECRGLARWDGGTWTPVPGLPDTGDFNVVTVYDGALHVAGNFTEIDGITMNSIARWDGTAWSALDGPSGTGTTNTVVDMLVWDDGDGADLYLTGLFDDAGGVPAAKIARWDGSDFSALDSGMDDTATSLAAWNDGSGEDLYVAGSFLTAGGLTVNRVARWDGAAWSALTGASGTGTNDDAAEIQVFEGMLHVGGKFSAAGGVTVNHIALWDGMEWWPLTDGSGAVGVERIVYSMASHDDGSGPALVISGGTPTGAGAPTDYVAQWDGADWADLSQPVAGPDLVAFSFASLDLGAGPFLAAGGPFHRAGGALSCGMGLWSCDSVPPAAPNRLESTTHQVGAPSTITVIEVEWEGATDAGPLGLWGDSWLFDQAADTVPDDRIENLAVDGVASASSGMLPLASGHWFHLKTCDRNRNCTTSHLGPFVIEAAGMIFIDGFESGDNSAWSAVVP